MKRRIVWHWGLAALAALLLAGCGGSPESLAAAACEAAAQEQASGKLLAVDLKALEQNAVAEGDSIYRLQGPVTFDTGLRSEYAQTLNCRVRFTNGKPQVIVVTFVF